MTRTETSEWIFINVAVLESGQKGGLTGRRRKGKGRQTDTDRASDRQMDKHGKVIDSWSGGESSRSVCSVCWSAFKTYTLYCPYLSVYPQPPSVCSPFCLFIFHRMQFPLLHSEAQITEDHVQLATKSNVAECSFLTNSFLKSLDICLMQPIEHMAVWCHSPSYLCYLCEALGRTSHSE